MGKELAKKSNDTERDFKIYKSRTPKVNDVVIICGDVDPVYYTTKNGEEYLNALPVLVNGQPAVLPLSSWSTACFDGINCFPQNKHEVTNLINSANCWVEMKGLANTPFVVVQHYTIRKEYKDPKRGKYDWTCIGCEWVEGADHNFTDEEKAALAALVAEAQAKANK